MDDRIPAKYPKYQSRENIPLNNIDYYKNLHYFFPRSLRRNFPQQNFAAALSKNVCMHIVKKSNMERKQNFIKIQFLTNLLTKANT